MALAGAVRAAGEVPERKSPTEALDLQRKIEDTVAGRRPAEPLAYPYFSPDYKLLFTHIGTFLDNFMLERLDAVERVIAKPQKHPKPLIEHSGLPWEETAFNPGITAAL